MGLLAEHALVLKRLAVAARAAGALVQLEADPEPDLAQILDGLGVN